MAETGKWLILGGILAIVAGLIFYFWGNQLRWIGHLPGDIKIEKENFRFYFPLTTMILFSLAVNLLIRLLRWLLPLFS